MDLNLKLVHFQDSSVDQEPFVHMEIAGEGREGRHDLVPGTAFDLVVLAAADTEAAAGTEPGLGVLVVVLDDIHSSCSRSGLRSAYSQGVMKDIRLAAGEVVAASPPVSWKVVNSSFVCGLDS
jgi:hypothetical protein